MFSSPLSISSASLSSLESLSSSDTEAEVTLLLLSLAGIV
jgi:hypothetical protein